MTFESKQTRSVEATDVGAYGLRLRGLDAARNLLSTTRSHWPACHVTIRAGKAHFSQDRLAEDVAEYRLRRGASVTINRSTAETTFVFPPTTPPPGPRELVHPYLFAPAATLNYWHGHQTFHAGAFVLNGGAWAVAGAKGAGKSSTLGWLATQGVPVLTDDLLVIADGHALAGPRCIDLRPDAAARLGVGENLGVVGERERWRHVIAAGPARVPLHGWIFPTWSDTCAVYAVPARERIPRHLANLALRAVPPRPQAFVELASLPSWVFARPRGWDSIATSLKRLLEHLGEC